MPPLNPRISPLLLTKPPLPSWMPLAAPPAVLWAMIDPALMIVPLTPPPVTIALPNR
ncbi:hypothetical protein D3C83_186700 [compost metagenome]